MIYFLALSSLVSIAALGYIAFFIYYEASVLRAPANEAFLRRLKVIEQTSPNSVTCQRLQAARDKVNKQTTGKDKNAVVIHSDALLPGLWILFSRNRNTQIASGIAFIAVAVSLSVAFYFNSQVEELIGLLTGVFLFPSI